MGHLFDLLLCWAKEANLPIFVYFFMVPFFFFYSKRDISWFSNFVFTSIINVCFWPPVRVEKTRGGRSRGGSCCGGACRGQLDPTQESCADWMWRWRGGGEHHGYSDEVPARPTARHAEEIADLTLLSIELSDYIRRAGLSQDLFNWTPPPMTQQWLT